MPALLLTNEMQEYVKLSAGPEVVILDNGQADALRNRVEQRSATPESEQKLVETINRKTAPFDLPRKPEVRTIAFNVTGMSEAQIEEFRSHLANLEGGQAIHTKPPVIDSKSDLVLIQVDGKSLENARKLMQSII